jgi:acetylornithine/succinyldiaminopimelate/putrescine aminotransferase
MRQSEEMRAASVQSDPGAESAQLGSGGRYAVAGLDLQFTAGQGNYLYWHDELGRPRRALDFTSADGASLFGHNHPEIITVALRHFHERRPALLQAARGGHVEKLKRLLSERIGRETNLEYEVVLFGSTVEALEAAIGHARLEFASRQKTLENQLLVQVAQWHRGSETQALARDPEFFASCERLLGGFEIGSIDALARAISGKNAPLLRHPGQVLAISSASAPVAHIDGVQIVGPGDRIDSVAQRSRAWFYRLELEPPFVVQRPFSTLAGVVLEPVSADRGVHPIDDHLVDDVQALRAEHPGVPFIIDETRTGLGRTGRFLEASAYGLPSDYVIIGKGLGGGITHLTALAIERTRYRSERFFWRRFAFVEDEYSSSIGAACLATIDRDRIPERCAKTGLVLRAALANVSRSWPAQVAGVRGRGLMLGLEFREQRANSSAMLRALDETQLLVPLIAGFLLHRHDLRVLPSSYGYRTLHIEPSAYIDAAEVRRLADGLGQACAILQAGDAFSLLVHLVRPHAILQPLQIAPAGRATKPRRSPWALQSHVALTGHHIEAEGWARADGSLTRFRSDELTRLIERLAPFLGRFSSTPAELPTDAART